jgi:AcrR family transcriptional regulator
MAHVAAKSGTPAGTTSARRELVLNEILEQATRLFAARGYEGTTLQDVAESVGITRPALYTYIASKEDLLGALVADLSQRTAVALKEIREQPTLAGPRIRAMVELVVRQRLAAPDRFRVLDREEASLPEDYARRHQKAKRDVLAHMRAVVADGVASGEFRPCDDRLAALSIIGMCNWTAWWVSSTEPPDPEPVVAELTANAEAMLRAPGGQAGGALGAIHRIRAELSYVERSLGS